MSKRVKDNGLFSSIGEKVLRKAIFGELCMINQEQESRGGSLKATTQIKINVEEISDIAEKFASNPEEKNALKIMIVAIMWEKVDEIFKSL